MAEIEDLGEELSQACEMLKRRFRAATLPPDDIVEPGRL